MPLSRYEARHAIPVEPRQPRVKLSVRPPRGWWVYVFILVFGVSLAVVAPKWHATPFTAEPSIITHPDFGASVRILEPGLPAAPGQPGHSLQAPLWKPASPAHNPAYQPVPATYTVQPGDTLGMIAAKTCPGTKASKAVSALSQANNLANPSLITAGEKLKVVC